MLASKARLCARLDTDLALITETVDWQPVGLHRSAFCLPVCCLPFVGCVLFALCCLPVVCLSWGPQSMLNLTLVPETVDGQPVGTSLQICLLSAFCSLSFMVCPSRPNWLYGQGKQQLAVSRRASDICCLSLLCSSDQLISKAETHFHIGKMLLLSLPLLPLLCLLSLLLCLILPA